MVRMPRRGRVAGRLSALVARHPGSYSGGGHRLQPALVTVLFSPSRCWPSCRALT
jgi:hypothetical protein